MYESPLRYPGGKSRLTQFIIDLFEMNGIIGGGYVEPYAGGAGVALSLLYLEYVDHIYLNDISRPLYSFWRSILMDSNDFCKLINDAPLTIDEWRRQKAIQSDPSATRLDLGFSTFYLNRTNKSGIINGGAIGGNDQSGRWKIDARFNRRDLMRRIEKVASYSPRISIYNMDAEEFVKIHVSCLGENTFVYLDPPYYGKKYRLYSDNYTCYDHERIAKTVESIKHRWIVSYDNAEQIRRWYSKYRQQTFSLRYTARQQYDGTEIMIFGDSVKSPGIIESWRGIAA